MNLREKKESRNEIGVVVVVVVAVVIVAKLS
jgi:hypothetical protein